MASREDHEAAGDATALDPDAHPVTFELAGASYCITVEHAVRLRADLDRQIPSEEADDEEIPVKVERPPRTPGFYPPGDTEEAEMADKAKHETDDGAMPRVWEGAGMEVCDWRDEERGVTISDGSDDHIRIFEPEQEEWLRGVLNERAATDRGSVIPSTRYPVTLFVLPGESGFLITVERAKEIRADLDRQIPGEEADDLHRLSPAQLGHLGEAIGKGFAEASGCKPHAMHGGGGFADKLAGAIRAGFETLDRRGMDG